MPYWRCETFWNWASYGLDVARNRGKTPCLINMDETSIARPAKARGCLCRVTMRPRASLHGVRGLLEEADKP